MAIQTDVIGDRGLLYESQYVRVDQVRCTKTEMVIEAGVYFTAEQAAGGMPPHMIEMFNGAFDLNAEENPWQQAYAVIKQRWSEAIDV